MTIICIANTSINTVELHEGATLAAAAEAACAHVASLVLMTPPLTASRPLVARTTTRSAD